MSPENYFFKFKSSCKRDVATYAVVLSVRIQSTTHLCAAINRFQLRPMEAVGEAVGFAYTQLVVMDIFPAPNVFTQSLGCIMNGAPAGSFLQNAS